MKVHEYLRDTRYTYCNCNFCKTRTQFTCIRCGFCWSCHWLKEEMERISPPDIVPLEVYTSKWWRLRQHHHHHHHIILLLKKMIIITSECYRNIIQTTITTSTRQRWTLLSMKNSIHKWERALLLGWRERLQKIFSFQLKFETVTHVKGMDINKGAITAFEEFLDKIAPLRTASCDKYCFKSSWGTNLVYK